MCSGTILGLLVLVVAALLAVLGFSIGGYIARDAFEHSRSWDPINHKESRQYPVGYSFVATIILEVFWGIVVCACLVTCGAVTECTDGIHTLWRRYLVGPFLRLCCPKCCHPEDTNERMVNIELQLRSINDRFQPYTNNQADELPSLSKFSSKSYDESYQPDEF